MDLFNAIERGHEDDVSRLLDADPNSLETQNHANVRKDRYRPLAWAAFNGRLSMSRLLVQRGANIDATDNLWRTALDCAASMGHEEMVAFLLSQGARADIGAAYGRTPLKSAAMEGHLGVVKMLVKHMEGQGLDERGEWGRTALDCAADNGHEEIVAFLASQGARAYIGDEDVRDPLISAAISGHLGVVKMLVKHMEGQGLDGTDNEGNTALCWAAKNGHEEIAAFLLSQGARADIGDVYGETPLISAAKSGHLGIVKMLVPLMGGQGLDETDILGDTALYWAANNGHEEIVAFLASQGARADTKDSTGMTPCMRAAAGGHLGVVKMLVPFMGGQGLDEQDEEGRTALCCAARNGHEEIVALLLSQGARADTKDSTGMTPYMRAAVWGHLGVVKMLVPLMGGQGLDEQDEEGRTALCCAARNGHEEMVRALLLAGADRKVTDGRGMTPLAIAHEEWHRGCVEMFIVSMPESILAVHGI